MRGVEDMGLFNFSKKIEPFPETGTASERKNWFLKTSLWDKVSPKIIDALVDKFGDNQLFVQFVMTSLELNLVSKYEDLGRGDYENSPDVVCALISDMLCKKGQDSSEIIATLFEGGDKTSGRLKEHYKNALNCLETCVVLAEQPQAYLHLAIIKTYSESFDQSLIFIDKGLKAISKFKSQKIPFELSHNDEIKNIPQYLEDMENEFIDMKKVISEKL
jgi:hypothetical protein